MYKLIAAGLALMVVLFGASIYAEVSAPIHNRADMIRATARVIVDDGSGSGVVIAQDAVGATILTVKHVIDGAHGKPITVRIMGKTYTVVSAWVDPMFDIGMLKIMTSDPLVVAPLCAHDPFPGDEVVTIGYPLNHLLVSIGYVGGSYDSYADWDGDQTLHVLGFVHSAPITFGSSGGPVFTRQGAGYCVAGVENLMLGQPPGIPMNTESAATSVSTIRQHLVPEKAA